MRLFHFSFEAMSCGNELQFYAPDEEKAAAVAESAISEVHRIERRYSRYREDSLVSAINRAAGGMALAVDEETTMLLDYADACYRQSEGRFDITSGVLRRAWNFRGGRIPAQEEIEALLPLVGWGKACWEKPLLRLPAAGMELNFGGIGKEYAADRTAAICLEMGCAHGFANLGGDLCVWGPQPDGSPWLVGIRQPGDGERMLARLPVYSGGLATSGDYARCLEIGGRRYSHLIDPRTGWPVEGLRSVTVQSASCMLAGSLSTIAMLKGADGLAWLRETGVPFLAVDGDERVYSSFSAA